MATHWPTTFRHSGPECVADTMFNREFFERSLAAKFSTTPLFSRTFYQSRLNIKRLLIPSLAVREHRHSYCAYVLRRFRSQKSAPLSRFSPLISIPGQLY